MTLYCFPLRESLAHTVANSGQCALGHGGSPAGAAVAKTDERILQS